MLFNVGDYVTRISYNNDTVFKIIEIKDSIAILQGVNIRLIADSNISDLVLCEKCKEDLETDDSKLLERMDSFNKLNRDEYFYLPGKVLHIDCKRYRYLTALTNFLLEKYPEDFSKLKRSFPPSTTSESPTAYFDGLKRKLYCETLSPSDKKAA